jgi:hypothetical protein
MNRKLLFVCTLLLCSYLLHAQIGKGSLMIGGQLGYTSNNSRAQAPNESFEGDTFGGSLSIGKAIKDRLFVGVELGSGLSNSEQYMGYNSHNVYYGAGVFMRKYFDIGKRFFVFTQANSGVSFFDNEATSPMDFTEDEGYNLLVSFSPGLSYALNRKLHLETGFQSIISASYSRGKVKRRSGQLTRHENFSVSTNLNNLASIRVGLRLLFAK